MKKIEITQSRSVIGTPEKQRKTMRGLGLRKIGHTVVKEDKPEIRGMIRKISHLLKVKEIK